LGTLTVSGSTLSGNSATYGGGIANSGTLTVMGSTVSGNTSNYYGGGIAGYGTLTVMGSTVSGNYGGGITHGGGTLTVMGSTVSGNTSAGFGYAGGIQTSGTSVTLTNVTVTGNRTIYYGGGLYIFSSSSVTLTNVTVTGNRANQGSGGGLYIYSNSAVLHNTLIAGNFRGATGTSRDDVSGALNSAGDYNLIGDGTGMTGLSDGVNGNLVGSAAAPIDPLLGPLQDNGGPTKTHALLAGSPAINSGNNAYATDWDQRGEGFPRIVNGIIDIGAFEYQGAGSAPLFSRSVRGNEPAIGALLFSLPPSKDQPIILSSVPGTLAARAPFDVTVQAVDVFGQVAFGYTGTVTFRITDSDPAVVLPLDYTFTADGHGGHTISGTFTLITPGDQTLTVADLANGLSTDVTLTVNP
jgi:hypothetical protein